MATRPSVGGPSVSTPLIPASSRGTNPRSSHPSSTARPPPSTRALTSLHPHHPTTPPVPTVGKLKADADSLDALFARWTHAVAEKMRTSRGRKRRELKRRKRAEMGLGSVVPIVESVFEPVVDEDGDEQDPFVSKGEEGKASARRRIRRTLDHGEPTTVAAFAKAVEAVREAIEDPDRPLHPRLNQSGSSGSYFCRAHVAKDDDGDGGEAVEVVGIFKPKDEEPYGDMNPKWTKWAHRVLLAPIIGGFGRGCLIPNLSYLSEAGASLLDRRLETYIVPRTEVVDIASPNFFYHFLVRKAAARKSKPVPLPEKPGSFQLFATGFEDASSLLRHHPWPGRPLDDTLDRDTHRHRRRRKRFSLYRLCCGNRFDFADEEEENPAAAAQGGEGARGEGGQEGWCWTKELMDDFRVEMEKLVILDTLMRNTDRGLDNFMIKICNADCRRSGEASSRSSKKDDDDGWSDRPHTHVAAIDNSLAFPHEHPRGWRSYPPGWLWLPVSLIGQPFSRPTRDHFLPLLTSPKWWAETTLELRQLFATDPDFNAKMFERQMAVVKGQGWTIVQSLTHDDEGPLELWRREKAMVYDDPVELPDTTETHQLLQAVATPLIASEPTASPAARARHSAFEPNASYGTLPMRRPTRPTRATTSTDAAPRPRPLPVSRGMLGMQGDFSGASGWDMMKHVDAVAAGEEQFSRSLGRHHPHHPRRFWSPPASQPSSSSGGPDRRRATTASPLPGPPVVEEEGEFPWGSFSEGDVRAQRRYDHEGPTSPTPAPPTLTTTTTSALDASPPVPVKGRLHRRAESAYVPSTIHALPSFSGPDETDALSDGGTEPVGERTALLAASRSSAVGSSTEAGEDGHATVLAVRERIEFVQGKATFAC